MVGIWGEHAIWGKHALFEESLLAPLIISYADMPEPDVASGAIVETLDIFPTLCELADLPQPDFVEGRSLKPILDDPLVEGRPAIAYTGRARTIRTSTHRLVLHNDGYQELYDHRTPAAETENVAERSPDLVHQLTGQLDRRLPRR
jgi:iduronate 2-sulfatase